MLLALLQGAAGPSSFRSGYRGVAWAAWLDMAATMKKHCFNEKN